MEGAMLMHREDLVIVLLTIVLEPFGPEIAGIVDEDIEPAERRERGIHDRLAALRGGHALGAGHCLATRRHDLIDHGLSGAGVKAGTGDTAAIIVDHHFRAKLAEQQCIAASQPARRACDNGCPAIESELAHRDDPLRVG